jgi:hypothetical protein
MSVPVTVSAVGEAASVYPRIAAQEISAALEES